MIINPTKIFDQTVIKFRIVRGLLIIMIVSLCIIPINIIYIPIMIIIGLIYQLYRYRNRLNRFVFLHGITEIETRIAFKWCDDDQIEKYEDIGFF